MKKFLGFVCLLVGLSVSASAQTIDWKTYRPEIPAAPVVTRPARAVLVKCDAGQRIQPAVDAATTATEILISGICVENVTIRDKDVSLRGVNKPSLDGIRSTIKATPALTIRGSVINMISDLSFSNSAGSAVAVRGGATPTISNCLFENNGGSGLVVNLGAFVTADTLTFNNNTSRSIGVSDGQMFCTGCDFTGNGFALVASRGAIASLLDSTVTGALGIFATDNGTLADIDCASVDTPHPCGMNVTGPALIATVDATGFLFGAGDFNGQVVAADGGTAVLLGARQLSGENFVDFYGHLVANSFPELSQPQSLIRDIDIQHFGSALIADNTILKGNIQCSRAGDAFLDPTVITIPGLTVTGCEHASVP